MKKNSVITVLMSVLLCAVLLVSCTSKKETTVEVIPSQINPDGPVSAAYIRTWPIGSTREDMDKGLYWKADDIKGEYLTDLIIEIGRASCRERV